MPLFYGESFDENPVTVVGGAKAAGLQPVVALQAGAGSTATFSLNAAANDRCGILTITSAGSGLAAGAQAIITFARAAGVPSVPFINPPVVLVSGQNAGAPTSVALVTATTTSTFTVALTVAPTASVTTIYYAVLASGT